MVSISTNRSAYLTLASIPETTNLQSPVDQPLSSPTNANIDLERASLIDSDDERLANQADDRQLKRACLTSVLLALAMTALMTVSVVWYTKHLIEQSFGHAIYSQNDSSSSSNQTLAQSDYHRVFNRWKQYCQSHNRVLARSDPHFGRLDDDKDRTRMWSMNDQSINWIDHSMNPSLPKCQSPDQLLDSIKYGTRISLTQLQHFMTHEPPSIALQQAINQSQSTINQSEIADSVFTPDQCTITWLSSDQICSLLSRFSHVALIGDSMSRHLIQTLYVALTEDFRMGALPLLSSSSDLYDNCQCDGMYSEHVTCRTFASDHLFHSTDARSYGVCHDAIDQDHRPWNTHYHVNQGPHGIDTVDYNYLCQPDDDRPRFIYLQGLIHYLPKATAEDAINQLIDPIMTQITNASQSCAKPFKFYVLFTGGHAQSRFLDSRYPHQSREAMIPKNILLKNHIEKWGHKAMEFWNLTRDAPSSDGLHHLTEVNLLKVQYILNYMDLLTQHHTDSMS